MWILKKKVKKINKKFENKLRWELKKESMEVEKWEEKNGNGEMLESYMGVDEKIMKWKENGKEKDIGMEIIEKGKNGVKIGRFEIKVRNEEIVMKGKMIFEELRGVGREEGK